MTDLGSFINAERRSRKMTLRDVEKASGCEISNAYLSQIENGRVEHPSPFFLYSIALAIDVPYETLMERAGYVQPPNMTKKVHRGRVIDNLTPDEERELRQYLAYLRSKKA